MHIAEIWVIENELLHILGVDVISSQFLRITDSYDPLYFKDSDNSIVRDHPFLCKFGTFFDSPTPYVLMLAKTR